MVSKDPASVPKARPIEDFWGVLKRRVYANNWKAKNIKELKGRLQLCLRQIDQNFVQKLAGQEKTQPYKIFFLNMYHKLQTIY